MVLRGRVTYDRRIAGGRAMVRFYTFLCLLILSSIASAWPPRLDRDGEPLPRGAIARLGTKRWKHTEAVRNVFWAADGKSIWTHTQDGFFRQWDASTGKELTREYVGAVGAWFAQCSADGKLLAVVSPNRLNLFDRGSKKQRQVE